jgi:hypothetical protein
VEIGSANDEGEPVNLASRWNRQQQDGRRGEADQCQTSPFAHIAHRKHDPGRIAGVGPFSLFRRWLRGQQTVPRNRQRRTDKTELTGGFRSQAASRLLFIVARLIMGGLGPDFNNFNVVHRDDWRCEASDRESDSDSTS